MPGSPQFPKIRSPEQPQQSRVQDGVAGQLAPIASAVAATPMLSGTLPLWTPPDLQGDFTNFAGFTATGYHKDSLCYVHGKGVVASAAGVAADARIYRLPQGMRPREKHAFAVPNGAGATALGVDADGWVTTLRAIAAGAAFGLEFCFLADG